MAAPTPVSSLTDWELFEGSPTFTSIGGGGGAGTSAEIFRQGSQSAGRKAGATGRFGFATTVTSVDFTVAGRYLWIWWMILYNPEQLVTRANGGVRIFIGTGGIVNYNEYYVGGSDYGPDGEPIQAGRWYRSCLDLNNISASNTGGSGATLTAVDRVGITVNYSTTPAGNLFHFYIDGAQYGNGFQFTGGSASDPVTMADIATYTEANSRAWGLATPYQGVFFCNGKITVGNGATATYFEDEGQVILWRPQEFDDGGSVPASGVSADFNQILVTGSGADFFLRGSFVKTVNDQDNERWKFDISSPNDVDIDGCTFTKAATFTLASGLSCINTVFDNCKQITPSTSVFQSNTIKNYVGTDGALYWPGGTTVTNCNFQNNDRAIEVTQAVDQEFDALFFTFDSNTYDVHLNNGGTDIDIDLTNGSDAATYIATGGGVVTFVASATHTLTGLQLNTEVTYMEYAGSVELFHVEDVDSTGETNYNYDALDPPTVDILIHHVDYIPILLPNVTLTAAGGEIPIIQAFDRIYENP